MRNILVPDLINFISGNEYEKAWKCDKCNKENKLFETEFEQEVLAEPCYLQVIPNPPVQRDGLMDRNQFNKKFSVWFWTFLNELEAQAAKYREDNWQKGGDMYHEDVDTEGEENIVD